MRIHLHELLIFGCLENHRFHGKSTCAFEKHSQQPPKSHHSITKIVNQYIGIGIFSHSAFVSLVTNPLCVILCCECVYVWQTKSCKKKTKQPAHKRQGRALYFRRCRYLGVYYKSDSNLTKPKTDIFLNWDGRRNHFVQLLRDQHKTTQQMHFTHDECSVQWLFCERAAAANVTSYPKYIYIYI